MPSNKILEEKKQVVESLAAKLQSAKAGVLVKYTSTFFSLFLVSFAITLPSVSF